MSEFSKHELLNWVNQTLGTQVAKIEHLNNGVAYCQLLSKIESTIDKKMYHKAKNYVECVSNIKLVQAYLSKQQVKKTFDVDKITRGSFHDNFEMLICLRKFLQQSTKENQPFVSNAPNQQTLKPICDCSIHIRTLESRLSETDTKLEEAVNTIQVIKQLLADDRIRELKEMLQVQQRINEPDAVFKTDSKKKQFVQQIEEYNQRLCQSSTPIPQQDDLVISNSSARRLLDIQSVKKTTPVFINDDYLLQDQMFYSAHSSAHNKQLQSQYRAPNQYPCQQQREELILQGQSSVKSVEIADEMPLNHSFNNFEQEQLQFQQQSQSLFEQQQPQEQALFQPQYSQQQQYQQQQQEFDNHQQAEQMKQSGYQQYPPPQTYQYTNQPQSPSVVQSKQKLQQFQENGLSSAKKQLQQDFQSKNKLMQLQQEMCSKNKQIFPQESFESKAKQVFTAPVFNQVPNSPYPKQNDYFQNSSQQCFPRSPIQSRQDFSPMYNNQIPNEIPRMSQSYHLPSQIEEEK